MRKTHSVCIHKTKVEIETWSKSIQKHKKKKKKNIILKSTKLMK